MPWRALVPVIACVSVFDVTLGMTYPLLALSLEARGVSGWAIGLNAAMVPLGLVAAAPLTPALAARIGGLRFAVACILSVPLVLALYRLLPPLAVWLMLGLLLGGVTGGLFAISEAWIAELAAGPARGRLVALYTSVLSLGFAGGPLLLSAIGSQGWTPFLVAIGFSLAALVPLLACPAALPAIRPEARASFLSFLPQAPVLLAAVGLFAVFDTVTLSLFPLYGLRKGLDQATAALALGVLIVGNVVLQLAVGWLADRWSRRGVMLLCAGLTVVGALLLPHLVTSLALWPLVFLWGATAFGIYTVALAALGDRFSGQRLLAGTAAFAAVWGLGGIVGPPLVGSAMQLFGPEGLPYSLASAYGLLLLLVALERR